MTMTPDPAEDAAASEPTDEENFPGLEPRVSPETAAALEGARALGDETAIDSPTD